MKSILNPTRRVNPRVSVDLIKVARAFLSQNPTSMDFDEVLDTFARKEYKLSKELFSVIQAKSLCIGCVEYSTTQQLGALLFKSEPDQATSESLRTEALASFLATEKRLNWVNWNLGYEKSLPNATDSQRRLFARARWLIGRCLPELKVALPKILEFSYPGPGVSLNTVDPARSAYCYKYSEQELGWYKLGESYHLPLLMSSKLHQLAVLGERGNLNPTIHSSNRVTFVPKNVTSLRPIAIEPNGQLMLQLGIHQYLSKKLTRLGNDIRSQERNKLLARIGSIDGSLATIDLKSASDSMSIALVYQLLPSDWFTFLYQNRAPAVELPDGTFHVYEKFSSMGNGMTFALETLIFWALSRAVCESGIVSVYGDDIIVPTNRAAEVIELLAYAGFTTNVEKTFINGPFRESCGSDWYKGVLVTPKYWRSSNRPLVTEVYEFINTCSRVAPSFNWGAVQNVLRNSLSDSGTRLLFGPTYMPENSCIHAPESYLKGSTKRRWDKNLQCYRYQVLSFRPSKKKADERKPYTALAMLRFGAVVSELPLRRLGKYRVVWMA